MRPDDLTEATRLRRLRQAEARLIARRNGAPDPAGAVREALAMVFDGAAPGDLAGAAQRIAAAVEAHAATFAADAEPDYHDSHHQAEATLAAGWLATEAAQHHGLIAPRGAALCVVAMAGHDLLHDGRVGGPPAWLEQRSAAAATGLCEALPEADRAEIARLILATDAGAPPPRDLAARLMREADLFASLTPCLGWRLSAALAREWARAGDPAAGRVATHRGRFALLSFLPPMTPAAVSLGLEAVRSLQLGALRLAGRAASPAEGAAALDALPPAQARDRWKAALRELGLPELP